MGCPPVEPCADNARMNPHRTRIKICGLTREQDVDAAVAAGADAVGFVLYPASARYVSLERALALHRRVPPFVTPVLLFVNEHPDAVRAARQHFPSAVLQFHGDESSARCAASGPGYIRAARIPLGEHSPAFDLVNYAADFKDAQAILLDAHVPGYGGGGERFDWSRIPINVGSRIVLSGGLTPANVGDGIAQLRPWAVDVSSGVEAAKGIKDPHLIHQFVAAVRRADAQLPNPL